MEAFPSRYVNLAAARRKFGDRVDRLGRFFAKVDPAADEAVEAIEALPRGEGWRMFEAGLSRGPLAIPGAPRPLRELIEPTFDEMEAIASSGDALSGVPPGFVDLDRITNGLHAGQMRRSGEAYISHPLAVAQIVAEQTNDPVTIAA